MPFVTSWEIAWGIAIALLSLSYTLRNKMGFFSSKKFDVDGKVVLITGGSQGMGRSVGGLLAEKGASVVIVARTESKLKESCEYISNKARDSKTQKFFYISADLTQPSDCARVIDECRKLFKGFPPDIVWCSAGTSAPTLFIESTPESLTEQLKSNYLSTAWTAQAAVKAWLAGRSEDTKSKEKPVYHLVFTSSVLAFYAVAGYGPYSPSKCALRSLSDTLSQELLLYQNSADIRTHTVFPATIFTEAYEAENRIKSDLTKMLEEDDEGQTPDACASAAIAGLEAGREIVPTTFLARLLMCSVLGGSRRGGGLAGFLDGILALIMIAITPWVRWFYDMKVKNWAKKHGQSGMKGTRCN